MDNASQNSTPSFSNFSKTPFARTNQSFDTMGETIESAIQTDSPTCSSNSTPDRKNAPPSPPTVNPKTSAGFMYKVLFCWVTSILRLGNKRTLEEDDLFSLLESARSELILRKIKENWTLELNAAERQRRRARLWRAALGVCSTTEYVSLIALKFCSSIATLSMSVILWFFLKALSQGSHMNTGRVCLFIVGLGVVGFVKVLCGHHAEYRARLCGMKIKVAVTAIVYDKLLSLSRSSLASITTGCVLNLISNDAQTMELLVASITYGVAAPFKILFATVLIAVLIGWQALSGMLFFFLVTAYTITAARQFGKLRVRGAAVTDRRLAVMSEIIAGIRAVKMYTWEWNYRDLIRQIRKKEMRFIRLRSLILSSFSALYFTSTSLATLISIATLLNSGIHLSAFQVFTLVVLLNMVRVSVVVGLAACLRGVVDGFTALERMERFVIKAEILSINNAKHDTINIKRRITTDQVDMLEIHSGFRNKLRDVVRVESYRTGKPLCLNFRTLTPFLRKKINCVPEVCFSDVSAEWNNDNTLALKNISFKVSGDKLVVIVGAVGSGKSSLLMSILGEIPLKSGDISGSGKLGFVPQQSWVFSGTIRDNILFGKPFNQLLYQNTLEACDLLKDQESFPCRDLSLIGENGASLSGGQQSRVCLARAVYSNADIILLDDPLSAVDAKVRQHLFDKCINGVLSGTLRILVTHQLDYLNKADHIILMKDNYIEVQGSYEQLLRNNVFREMLEMRHIGQGTNKEQFYDRNGENTCLVAKDENLNDIGEALYRVKRCQGLVVEDEDRAVGTVSWRLYWNYFRAGSPFFRVICLFAFFIFVQAALLAPNWWLSQISEMSLPQQKSCVTFGVYCVTVGGALVLSTVRSFWFYYAVLSSSENLHDKMTLAVIKSPVLFFDQTPSGRILNRFSRDIGCMDNLLPRSFLWAMTLCLSSLSTILVPVGANAWLLIAVCPLIAVLVYLGRYYLRASRELKRLEAARCTPVYSHFADTIKGMEVICASRMEGRFLDTFNRCQDGYTKTLFMVISCNEWLGLRLDLLCVGLVTIIAMAALLVTESPALAGMSLSFAFETLEAIQYGVTQCSEVENYMTSAERVMTYTKLPSEPGYSRQAQPPEDWPDKGRLSIQGLSLVYFEGGPRILDNLCMDIKAKEKIGIAGRTGTGKTSIVASLFRMPDPSGKVLIDGVDLGTLEIQAARRAIAAITQNPVLFGGTLRRNLDPFNQFTDLEIWTALKEVQLQDTISCLSGQLSHEVGESGSNFSVGERQLLCLARALLQRCKILVMDEATANVDYKTDHLIQQVIRYKFSDCTVLTIAHRLNTIMDYDRVVVLDRGHVIECDKPQVLAEKNCGEFGSLRRINQ